MSMWARVTLRVTVAGSRMPATGLSCCMVLVLNTGMRVSNGLLPIKGRGRGRRQGGSTVTGHHRMTIYGHNT